MVKLNLGCGTDVRPDYINVDFRKMHPSVHEVDLSVLPWPFEDGYADEIMMLDFLEHFEHHRTRKILLECRRILKKGGLLVVQVPDMEICCKAMLMQAGIPCNICGTDMQKDVDHCVKCGTDWSDIAEAGMKRAYGGQDYPGNYHMTGFDRHTLESKLEQTAFVGVRFVEEWHMRLNWNIKAVARKL